ncbi:hypothetical protein AVEN_32963-1 [Araneus ventricosus]|uniref:No apical meristem-associated C-terminal domain-containing protein n=1 Tax=Araneus ventricosus TaxID=182803 RepID=A0A4Y2IQ57_ARAVE|nr:hypothetical protein AVEN_32963-1 [Araneus ventricosus]
MRTPLSNLYDDDHLYHVMTETPPPQLPADNSFSDVMEESGGWRSEESINPPEDATEQPGPSDADFSSETQAGKKTPISRWKIKRKRRTPCTTVAAMAIAEERKVSADQLKLKNNMEMEQKREEHEESMAIRQEEHVMNMKIKQEQHDLKMKIMAEKLNVLKESAIKGTYKGSFDSDL